MRVFIAGAAGVIGRKLVPLLLTAGHAVTGTTRSPAKAETLRAAGATGVVVDVFDAAALREAVRAARPDVVVHQLTDLPRNLPPDRLAEGLARNARIRTEGTRNLVEAARLAGARRLVAQSIAWAYAPGPEPHSEKDPLDLGADGPRGVTVGGIAELERLVTSTPGFDGLALRYGRWYGPETGAETPPGGVSVHVDAAAWAAALAIDRGPAGIYNVVDDGGTAANAKARRELGWEPSFRLKG